ncbi:MAG TPA: zf-HC2 domain-containing protein [Vicinamibacterales bacterium]|nr:zf-HC2 domain-containing protein [Vicinamibacterales bacterium]
MHEEWTDKLSDYLDDELTADERAAVAQHLASCAHCAKVAADLEKVVMRAGSAAPRPPQADLWPGVHARIEKTAQPRRVSLTLPQLAAAAALLVAVSGGIAWQTAQRTAATTVAQNPTTTPAPVEAVVDRTPTPATALATTVSYADAQYDAAVSDLEKAVKNGRGRLDASTIAIVEHNLQIIDQAIEQARQALETDPANSYLSGHLVEARRRKLDLLRRAAALTETD